MVQFVPGRNDYGQAAQGFGEGLTQGYMHHSDEKALRNAIGGLSPNATPRDILDAITKTKTYGNEGKQRLFENYFGAEKFEELKRAAQAKEGLKELELETKAEREASKTVSPQERQAEMLNYLNRGYDELEAEFLTNPHTTKAQKQALSKRVEDEIARGIRKPVTHNESQVAIETPQAEIIAEQQGEAPVIEEAIIPEPVKANQWPKIEPPIETTPADRVKWRMTNQKENNKLLKETGDKLKSHENSLIRNRILKKINDSKKLPQKLGSAIINPETGEPYGVASLAGLVNEETQRFTKTLNDFLIDAKTYFGARVTNFDITAFKSRLPGLLNSESGRRVIIEQMRLMEELQKVHDEELYNGLKYYGDSASYGQIQKVVDERTSAKESEVIAKIDNIDEASKYLTKMNDNPKYKDYVLMQDPEGKFRAIRKQDVSEAKKEQYKEW